MHVTAGGSHGLNSVLLKRKILRLAGCRHNDEIERRRNADDLIAKQAPVRFGMTSWSDWQLCAVGSGPA